ncbi:MAG: M48 family metallopeptidase [Mobilicoccus sp.]|nr:M48 family metallopeptidase [Mobilicoccus sp.]
MTRPDLLDVDGTVVHVRRSGRRRRTVSARWEAGDLILLVPATLTATQEREFAERLTRRLQAREQVGDGDLEHRAAELSARYLQGRARPTSVRWTARQQRRWGSCTPATGAIRIAESVRGMPQEVLDYVILHELAHLLVPGHGARFWAELADYPALDRARGFLDGVSFATDRALTTPAGE